MAKGEVITRWKADTKDYDANVAKAKKQLENFGKENFTAGGAMKQMTSQLVATAAKFASFGAAAAAAMKVVKDAFFSNEQQLDEWGRVVESSKSLYNGFLNALNNGDISGYLNNISNITNAAREAYDALDALATYNAFNQINVEKTRTSMTESIADYRSGTGTKDAVRAAGDAYKKELEERKKLEKEAYLAKVKEVAAQRGVNANDLITALSGTYGSYQMLKNVQPTGSKTVYYGGGMFGGGGSYTVDVAVGRQEKLGAALRALNDTELQSLQALGAQAERTGNEIAQVDKQLVRVLNGRGGASGGGVGGRTRSGGGGSTYVPAEGSIDAQTEAVQKLEKAWRAAADDDSRRKIKEEIQDAQFVLDVMTGKTTIPAMNYGIAQLAGKGGWTLSSETMARVPGYRQVGPTGLGSGEKEAVSLTKSIGDITSNISGIASNLEQLGVNIPQELKNVFSGIQAITSILTTITTIITAIQAISAADTIIPFARGGIVRAAGGYRVPGNYGYDAVPAMLTSGELVLNRAQQGALASALTGSNTQQLEAVVSAEQIRFVLNNNARRRGASEYITIK